ncbi:uncharacterized protein LOC132390075 isoform X4 [Hypanus sabinus]|uniref:uncharacterized protein LOC132390075 isoform X4 n=1 Tax=Hypanus sabinus TaxID=79690 RepID=UPI0028C3DA60|nr:uncharacterized protein LOC132390075 isoform X4 [Hypanus sabinus]
MLTFPGWAVIFFLCVEAGLERWIVHGIRIGRGSSPPRAASRGGRSDHSLRSGTDKIHATCGERFIGRKAHNWKQTTTEDEGTATSEPARGLRASTGENPSDSEIPLIQSGESLIVTDRESYNLCSVCYLNVLACDAATNRCLFVPVPSRTCALGNKFNRT